MKKRILTSIGLMIFALTNAQSVTEAYQINSLETFGTARSMGMSGAFNGLGADISSSYYNPANAGNLSKSQFSFSPYINTTHSLGPNGGYLNTKTNLAISNFVYTLVDKKNRWTFQYQKQADFHQKLSDSYTGSLLNFWSNQANASSATSIEGLDQVYPTSAGLAYHAFLLNQDTVQEVWFPVDNETANQSRSTVRRGKSNVFSLSFARKLSKSFNFGASLNMPRYFHREVSVYSESDFDTNTDHQGLEVTDIVEVNGTGLNLKIGTNVKLAKKIRISAAYQTPTLMWMNQSYESTIVSQSAQWGEFTANQPGLFDYYHIKPQRIDLGVGLIANKSIALGIDYTYQDNSASKFISNNSSYSLDYANTAITNELSALHQLRAGIEGRIQNFYLRAGASYTSDSYSSSNNFSDIKGGSLGFGVNRANSRFDIGVQNLQREERVYDYAPFETSSVRKINETKLVATWTWRM